MTTGTYTRRCFLKTIGFGAASLAIGGCTGDYRQPMGGKGKDKPNIIFILVDDLGWAELGCYGNRFNETPNIDKLAEQGMRFTDAYSAAPVCSPMRASFVTGQYPARLDINSHLAPWDARHLPTDQVTIAQMLKREGYTSGIIGKWHLTGYYNHHAEEFPPSQYGFDETLISENRGIGGGSYYYPYHFNREIEKRLPGKEYLIDRMNLEAVEFVERHRREPFFLFLSHYAVHNLVLGKEEMVAKYATEEVKSRFYESRSRPHNNPHLASQLEVIDEGVGMIMEKLDKLGLADNTILIFTSDNGGSLTATRNDPLRGGKGQLYEGGVREPLVVRWPGVVPAASVCNQTTSSIDFYPTFLEAANIVPDSAQHTDGVSIVSVLKNPNQILERDTLYWHYPYDRGTNAGTVRKGDWKLIKFYDGNKVELYNLADDISETNNLAKEHSDKAAELEKMLTDWHKEVDAKFADDKK